MNDPRPVLLVGYSPALLDEFGRFLPANGLVILEEPDPVRKRGAREKAGPAPVCRELIEDEFLLPGGADRFYLRHRDLAPVAVIPAHEYAVPAAARLAERYGTPGATFGAAQLLRDKQLLRIAAGAAGLGNPASRAVTSADEVTAFQRQVGGPVIIKPANRQAAVGTRVVTDPADIAEAWQYCLQQVDETCLPDRDVEVRMLVEQFVEGDEYSVEMLTAAGRRVFANVTAKRLFAGPHPVEQGHLVPAPIPPALTERLVADTERLLDGVGFGTGLVHCEWIVQRGQPFLVECAGRQPGDFILELVQGAYAFDLYRAYVDLMRGEDPGTLPARATGGAVSWFAVAEPGEVLSVGGVEDAQAVPGVRTCAAQVSAGDRVGELRSSWDRVAVVTAHAGSVPEAQHQAQQAIDLIRVETKPV